jgi:hypothetical protein
MALFSIRYFLSESLKISKGVCPKSSYRAALYYFKEV